jgi:hypothetical protein
VERFALGLATMLTAIGLYLVPSWHDEYFEPCHMAMIASGVLIVLLYVARWMGPSGTAIERTALTIFLAGMPLVYMARSEREWLWLEGVGLVIFGACATLGMKRSVWFLAAGIAAHGIAWDSWHYFGVSPFMPSWYTLGCLLVDIGIGAYAGVRAARE